MSRDELDRVYDELAEAKRRGNRPRMIALYREAIALTMPREFGDWFPVAYALAVALVTDQDRNSEGVEEALGLLRQAVGAAEAAGRPKELAEAHRSLASAYARRQEGSRRDNLERAIGHSRAALQGYRRDIDPAGWALTVSYIGYLYSYRVAGNRAANLATAIRYYEQALTVYTEADHPQERADTEEILAHFREQQRELGH